MATSPNWNPENLTRHHRKRTIGRDAGCFEDLLGITDRMMTESEYDARSIDAIDDAWGEYEAEQHIGINEYEEARVYYVDPVLVVVITDGFRRDIITCFHEHFDRPHSSPSRSAGQRQLRYKERLQTEEKAALIRKVRRIRGV